MDLGYDVKIQMMECNKSCHVSPFLMGHASARASIIVGSAKG